VVVAASKVEARGGKVEAGGGKVEAGGGKVEAGGGKVEAGVGKVLAAAPGKVLAGATDDAAVVRFSWTSDASADGDNPTEVISICSTWPLGAGTVTNRRGCPLSLRAPIVAL
jgi:hypothetical protein